MDLANSFKIVVHYLLIGEMTNFGHQDKVIMVSALMYIVIY